MSEKGPIISRSKVQLALSYAPGSLFTFEGGKGCFLSVPILTNAYNSNIVTVVAQQIEEQMREIISNWFQAGMRTRDASGPPVYPRQVLDRAAFLDFREEPAFDMSQFILLEPTQIGYYPDPLNFVCADCGLLHKYSDVDVYARSNEEQKNRTDCKKTGGKHRWVQLDVVFAHWSGNYEPLFPERPCQCGNNEFYLIKSNTGVFSDWHFKCSKEGCPSTQELTRRDPKTKELLEEKIRQGTVHQPKEMLMLPVSYRASSLYYVQTDRFIPYPDAAIFELLRPDKQDDLAGELMTIYNYPQRPASDDEMKAALENAGQGGAYVVYAGMKTMKAAAPADVASHFQEQLDKMVEDWRQKGWLERGVAIPDELSARVRERQDYTRRFDPIRLGIEHSRLQEKKLQTAGGIRKQIFDLLNPPPDVAPEGTSKQEVKEVYQERLRTVLGQLGVSKFLMLRELDLVQYSYGYTRVSPTPTTEQKGLQMPVCLRSFEPVARGQRPLYVLHQKNEAFYVQLDEAMVLTWLGANQLPGLHLANGRKFGASYIEQYFDFGPYLDDYKSQEADVARTICNMTYMLLHTMAHQFIVTISEFSGLEQGSFGEYLFPADLAFIVYRSGMTPDLGNLSSMWRNFNVTVLEQLLSANKLQCSSGSLCDHRGGACPGCIMLPETTCIAGNQLLSRSALKNGPAPRWSLQREDLVGYFTFTTA
ncbi:hypothetical protein [Geomonas edaphica]|uniref:hypothetical protein n=1 Tax=Geomonas edaphica TaxID=2570226 RepID=UPI0010A83EB0|nr:hypothetical protein [Geomonas edaphica]